MKLHSSSSCCVIQEDLWLFDIPPTGNEKTGNKIHQNNSIFHQQTHSQERGNWTPQITPPQVGWLEYGQKEVYDTNGYKRCSQSRGGENLRGY